MFSSLNKNQLKAVETLEGPVLVVAGAGSGKTSVLTNRIANLIIKGVALPSEILAFTFTNKAASQMRERIHSMDIGPLTGMWIGTFHSICVRILRDHATQIGYKKNFVIYDVSEQKALLRKIIKSENYDIKTYVPAEIQRGISKYKNRLSLKEIKNDRYDNIFEDDQSLREIFNTYNSSLKRNNAMDFDDLINYTIRLFENNEGTLNKYNDRFKFIHVDEYQDTNTAQYRLIKLLAKDHSIFAVGDTDQSIYGWRGADISNIRDFKVDFPGAQTIILDQNYRSTNNILKLANSVIKNNTSRHDKELWSDKNDGEKVTYFSSYDEGNEATYIAEYISQIPKSERGEVAVLYRNNSQSRPVEDALLRANIKHKIHGGLKFYDRKDVKDILSYMKLIYNNSDDISLLRIINVPKRGIGAKTIEKLIDYAVGKGISLLEAAKSPDISVADSTIAKVKHFADIIERISSTENKQAINIYKMILEETQIIEKLEEVNSVEAHSSIDNINELGNSISEFMGMELEEYLSEISLRSDQDDISEETGIVTLMTVHTAKGLEYDTIFLIGLNEGILPSSRASETLQGLEEERRLCYVAITRARKKLYISNSKRRRIAGEYKSAIPSRFLREMHSESVQAVGELGQAQWTDYLQSKEDREKIEELYAKTKVTPRSGRSIKGASNYAGDSGKKDYAPGSKVEHSTFGVGTVISQSGDIVTIAFNAMGIKKLSASLAPMTPKE